MTITIKDTDVTLRYSMRSMIIYEKITNQSFNPSGLTEIMIYFYSTVLASSKDIELTFDEFIDWLDEKPYMIQTFSEWLTTVVEKNSYIQQNVKSNGGKSKKK